MKLDIDFFKNNCLRAPWQHGLGFIALEMNDGSRINFHSDLSNHEAKSPHSHGGSFNSECLFGKLKNIIYSYEEVPESDWYLASVTCEAGVEPEIISDNIKPIIVSEEIQNKGDIIHHFHKNIHDFEILSKYACTKVNFTTPVVEDPIVIKNKNVELVCAYANRGTAEENWEIINQILKEQ